MWINFAYYNFVKWMTLDLAAKSQAHCRKVSIQSRTMSQAISMDFCRHCVCFTMHRQNPNAFTNCAIKTSKEQRTIVRTLKVDSTLHLPMLITITIALLCSPSIQIFDKCFFSIWSVVLPPSRILSDQNHLAYTNTHLR